MTLFSFLLIYTVLTMWVWLLVGCLIAAAAYYYYTTEQTELKLREEEKAQADAKALAAAEELKKKEEELKRAAEEMLRKEEEAKRAAEEVLRKEQEARDAAAALLKARSDCNVVMHDWVINKNWAFQDSAKTFAECKGQPSRWFEAARGVSLDGVNWKPYKTQADAYDMLKLL